MIYKREIADQILKYLDDKEIIVLHGARQVGKTSIMRYLMDFLDQKAKKYIYHDLEDIRYREIYNQDIDSIAQFWRSIGLSESEKMYLFLDEIQYLNDPSSFLKLAHDHHTNKKLVVSGSSSFEIKSKFSDSLTGRTVDFEIFGLSFAEFLLFRNESLSITERSDFAIAKLQKLWEEYALFGAYPRIVLEPDYEKKERFLRQILETYLEKDVRDIGNIRNIDGFNGLVEVLASNIGGLLNVAEISNSLRISQPTILDYLSLLENTYVIKRLRPYHKNIRSELTKMPKIQFEDTGLANLLRHRKTIGNMLSGELFENSVYHALRLKHPNTLYFWRTNTQKEIDFVIDDRQGVTAIEVKYSRQKTSQEKPLLFFRDNYPSAQIYLCCLHDSFADTRKARTIFPWEI